MLASLLRFPTIKTQRKEPRLVEWKLCDKLDRLSFKYRCCLYRAKCHYTMTFPVPLQRGQGMFGLIVCALTRDPLQSVHVLYVWQLQVFIASSVMCILSHLGHFHVIGSNLLFRISFICNAIVAIFSTTFWRVLGTFRATEAATTKPIQPIKIKIFATALREV